MEKKLDGVEQNNTDLVHEMRKQTIVLKDKEAQLSRLEHKLKNQEEAIIRSKSDISFKENIIEELQSNAEDKEKEISQQKSNIDNLTHNLHKMTVVLKLKDGQIRSLQRQTKNHEEIVANLKAEIAHSDKVIDDFKIIVEKLNEQVRKNKNIAQELHQNKMAMKEKDATLLKLQTRIRELEEEVVNLKSEILFKDKVIGKIEVQKSDARNLKAQKSQRSMKTIEKVRSRKSIEIHVAEKQPKTPCDTKDNKATHKKQTRGRRYQNYEKIAISNIELPNEDDLNIYRDMYYSAMND